MKKKDSNRLYEHYLIGTVSSSIQPAVCLSQVLPSTDLDLLTATNIQKKTVRGAVKARLNSYTIIIAVSQNVSRACVVALEEGEVRGAVFLEEGNPRAEFLLNKPYTVHIPLGSEQGNPVVFLMKPKALWASE